MMTLYLAFNELKHNRMNLDDQVTISQNAASEPSSKLWLLAGQRVSVKTLIRGAAIRSANDAATAIGEHISGSEAKFADYMTLTAREMGMSKTTFKNAHGLTSSNHLSSPRDMAILARRLIFDFPQYYNLFGRQSVSALGKTLYNTNRRFLTAYSGSDGIKTGFTSLAGYNLAASASRGNIRIIGVVFGAGSVGLSAIMAANIVGCNNLVAVDINNERLNIAQKLGATHIINSKNDNVIDKINEITNGKGSDFSLETAGTETTFKNAIDCLSNLGTCGIVTTPLKGQMFPFSPTSILLGGKKLIGILMGSSIPEIFIPKLINLYIKGKLPFDTFVKYYKFNEINQAVEDSKKGKIIKPILLMD